MDAVSLVNLGPVLPLALLAVLLALGPLLWVSRRTRGAGPARRLHALTLLTLFLTFDLVLFGAFTRLTDSGLGCPDWPGCYGSATPLGAHQEISAAQSALPSGPVTHRKAWIEMIHRYLAMGVGVLILAITVLSWRLERHRDPQAANSPSPWWPTLTLVWVAIQGAFGAWTVTLKLYPAIVTAHLLGGLVLLALLAAQAWGGAPRTAVLPGVRRGVALVAVLAVAQIALGGWVSTNYAVLACTEFPGCQGQWWPPMDFDQGFSILRPLGGSADSGWLTVEALTAIHMAHRLGAGVLLLAMAGLSWSVLGVAPLRRLGWALVAVGLWQLATGVSNVVLGWPLLAAVGHTGGAAALVLVLSALWARTRSHTGGIPAGDTPTHRARVALRKIDSASHV